ncbi:hypothetical protein C0991_011449 [Blastosporella zonata]|nr:hypothetical protein C0991_011449 [Blastosporella zonata]
MTTNTNSLLGTVPKLGAQKSDGTSTTYQDWKFAMMMVLRRAGCWDIMTKEKPSTREGQKDWESKAEEALTAIGLTVDPRRGHLARHCRKRKTEEAADKANFAIDEYTF